MNLNLNRGADPDDGLETETVQAEIDEHIEIMANAGISSDQVMLLSDPEYPGAYRVWLRGEQDPYDHMYKWSWVNPSGEVEETKRPWVVK